MTDSILTNYKSTIKEIFNREIFNKYPRLQFLYRGLKGFLLGAPPVSLNFSHIFELNHIFIPNRSEFSEPRINLVIHSINSKFVFGGVSTALDFLNSISPYFKYVRIITLDEPTSETLKKYSEYCYVTLEQLEQNEHKHQSKEILSLHDYNEHTLALGNNDILIGTYWLTAYMAQRFAVWQSQAFNQPVKPIIYLIQDYEPGFYAWSSHYLLVRSTYEYRHPMVAFYNTRLLQEYFHRHNYKFAHEYSFEPRMNQKLAEKYSKLKGIKKNKQILIYGRPSVMRNAFSLIIEALRIWYKQYPQSSTWTIISAGESHVDLPIGENLVIKSVGKLSLEDYAITLGKSAIGISFMCSPHPSYPPLEMSHYGIWVLTNSYDNKNLSSWHDNIVSLDDISPENIANNLISLCQRFEEDPTLGWAGYSSMDHYLSDISPFTFAEEISNILQKEVVKF